jgi:arylsulfatase A-like enzyme
MLEGGARVPLIASWPGTMPAGKVCPDMVDFTDLLPTFAELANAKVPADVTFDGRSFAPQLRGQAGKPRDWIFVQLGKEWYVRTRQWKLTQAGELYDMTNAPFAEKPVPAGEQTDARKQLQAILDQLNPAAGKDAAGNGARRKKRK